MENLVFSTFPDVHITTALAARQYSQQVLFAYFNVTYETQFQE